MFLWMGLLSTCKYYFSVVKFVVCLLCDYLASKRIWIFLNRDITSNSMPHVQKLNLTFVGVGGRFVHIQLYY